MDMDSFKSINEQRATVRHGRPIPVVSGLRPVAICIEWLTRTHTGTRTAHTMNPANDSMTVWQINMFAIGAKESIKKDKRNLPKNVSKRSASLHACIFCPHTVLVWLIHSPVTNSTPTRTATTRIVPIWRPPDLTFFREPPFPLPFGFGLRLTMHANDGICCPSGLEEELGLGML